MMSPRTSLWLVFKQVATVLRKELAVELRRASRISGVFFFALALLVMVAFASPSTSALRDHAGGTLWIGLLLASTRALDQSYMSEHEHGTMEGMVLWPVEPWAIFYGKALANTMLLSLVAFGLLPLLVGLFDLSVHGETSSLVGFTLLGCAALAAPGTLYGLIASQARGSSVLLPLLLFPLVIPAMMAAARGTALVFEGDAMGDSILWLQLLGGFNVVHWSLSGLLYGRIVEDS
jgi:heme exporter protein B